MLSTRWKVSVTFRLGDGEKLQTQVFLAEDAGRREIEDWVRRSNGKNEGFSHLTFATADGGRQFFSPHTVRRVEILPEERPR